MPDNIGISANNTRLELKPDGLRVSRPPVDIISKPKKLVINPPAELLFMASDGKTYDFKAFAYDFLGKYEDEIIKNHDSRGFLHKISRMFNDCDLDKDELEFYCLIGDLREAIYKADNIEELFEILTGKKYSKENLNKLLKQEIHLKIYDKFKQLYEKKEPKSKAMPTLASNYYAKPSKKIELNKQEKNFYNNISKKLDNEYREKLSKLLSQGVLTQEKAENNTTILENLYKIISTPRYQGLDSVNILKECIDILENPSIITQLGEDIPEKYQAEAIEKIYKANKTQILSEWKNEQIMFASVNSDNKPKTNPTETDLKEFIRKKMNGRSVGTCAAASLEYDLATKYSAEFFRMVEAFTSQNPKTSKKITLNYPE